MSVFIGGVAGRGDPDCHEDKGLLCDFYILNTISIWGPIIYAGIYSATFSSGLGSLVGAPRILMAVAKDEIIPSLSPFKKTNSKGDPIRGYILSFLIVFGCNMIGSLNAVAPLITMFFLMTYTLLNASCFFLSYSKSPGWRPGFKYYSKWSALFGTLSCFTIMILIDYWYALVTFLVGFGLYVYINFWVDPPVNWGSALEARRYMNTYKALMKLSDEKGHVKNFRPVFLVLVGDPQKRTDLLHFTQTFRHNYAPIIYGNIFQGDYRQDIQKFRDQFAEHGRGYLLQEQPPIQGLYDCVIAKSIREGCAMFMQLSGLGGLQPNTVVLGFQEKWKSYTGKSEEDR
eukprot:UN24460